MTHHTNTSITEDINRIGQLSRNLDTPNEQFERECRERLAELSSHYWGDTYGDKLLAVQNTITATQLNGGSNGN